MLACSRLVSSLFSRKYVCSGAHASLSKTRHQVCFLWQIFTRRDPSEIFSKSPSRDSLSENKLLVLPWVRAPPQIKETLVNFRYL